MGWPQGMVEADSRDENMSTRHTFILKEERQRGYETIRIETLH